MIAQHTHTIHFSNKRIRIALLYTYYFQCAFYYYYCASYYTPIGLHAHTYTHPHTFLLPIEGGLREGSEPLTPTHPLTYIHIPCLSLSFPASPQCMMLNYDACNPKRVNRLFTCFDLERQDRMDFRAFLSTMRTLRRASESPVDKILAYFDFFDFLGEFVRSTVTRILCIPTVGDEFIEFHSMAVTFNLPSTYGAAHCNI